MLGQKLAIHHRPPAQLIGHAAPDQRSVRMGFQQGRIARLNQLLQGHGLQLIDL